MKRTGTLLLTVLLCAVLLCACGKNAETAGSVRTVTVNGTDYTVDEAAGTIRDGKYTYRYTLQPKASGGYSLHITYPGGTTWWWTQEKNGGQGGFSDSYYDLNPEFPDGFTLRDVLETQLPRSGGDINVLLAIFLLIVGLLNTFAPQIVWELRYGWHYKDAEPSELSLGVSRAVGIICLVIAVIMILAAVF